MTVSSVYKHDMKKSEYTLFSSFVKMESSGLDRVQEMEDIFGKTSGNPRHLL